jgi:hypothetical protein
MADVFERFTRREELLSFKKHNLNKAIAKCSLDMYRQGSIHPASRASFDVALSEMRSFLNDLEQEMHNEPLLDDHDLAN